MSPLSLLIAAATGAGVLLCLSPWLWPRGSTRRSSRATQWLRTELAQAGAPRLSPARFVVLSVLAAMVSGSLSLAVSGIAIVGVLGTLVGLAAPLLLLRNRAAAHRRALQGVWPDLIDHLIGSIRAGLGLPDALCRLSENGPAVLRPAFAEFERDYQQSGSWQLALDSLKSRLADPTSDRLCELLRVAREVGGTDLVPVLRAFGVYLREDAAMLAELSARQSWVTNAAKLGAVAPWILLLLLSTRPEARVAYNSTGGVLLILFGFVLTVVAYQLMRAVGKFRREKRWIAS